ncbi:MULTISPECIES: hypothetical protein [Streptomyces]|uniref:Uncharacterized protein n=2 Tax=Streptomyces TaxID=1883 RepID=A0ABS9JVW9_9ACTN|nr:MULTISPECIES: hypothetical protein [Streptomyces]MCG0069711.1 hypothetical protein [Streptomyces tricolor]OYP14048.1 hypothetical protein CFC35_05640 [Streptomyces sp. FBKL.4005]BCM70892.1 hypothetical protein EASAB2608_06226 [Streptomyces sp. EAS-AB2608]
MAESDDYRTVIREEDDGTRLIAVVRRDPETDQLADDEIITDLKQWIATRKQPDRERWPKPAPFNTWLMTTKPGSKDPCPECGCYSLRLAPVPDKPGEERVICTMSQCEASPFYRD